MKNFHAGAVIVNATPHDINIVVAEGITVTIPRGDVVARAATTMADAGTVSFGGVAIPVTTTVFGALAGLPDEVPGVYYVVSGLAASAAVGRNDLFTPGPLVRDAAGVVIGCRGLNRP